MAKVEIIARENGPLFVMVNGELETVLCRCGGSGKKPYCDGTHKKIGFKAPGGTVVKLEE